MTPELARAALKKYFGYDNFRPLQQQIIEATYAGKDGIVLMPTGGGKSMCFQIPAVTMTGTVVVVSPLISLMKDQVDGLNAVGIRAAFLNSSQSGGDSHQVETAYENGELHLLYVSPEKLLSAGFFTFLKRRRICLFAIDEAHCISAWGHDFRPEYTKLKSLKQVFPEVPIMALTATADRLTRKDMAEQLGIPDAEEYIASFNRPNLSLAVRKTNRAVVIDEAWPFAGVSSEVAYEIQRTAFDYLDAPVIRVNSADTSLGYAPTFVEEYLPNPAKIIKAVKEVAYVK